jgi:hypothetical protein
MIVRENENHVDDRSGLLLDSQSSPTGKSWGDKPSNKVISSPNAGALD